MVPVDSTPRCTGSFSPVASYQYIWNLWSAINCSNQIDMTVFQTSRPHMWLVQTSHTINPASHRDKRRPTMTSAFAISAELREHQSSTLAP